MPIESDGGQLGFTDEEMGIIDSNSKKVRVEVDPRFSYQAEINTDGIDLTNSEKAKRQMLDFAQKTRFEHDPLSGASEFNPHPDFTPLNMVELLERELFTNNLEEDGFDLLAKDQPRMQALSKVLIERIGDDPKKIRALAESFNSHYLPGLEFEIHRLEVESEELSKENDDNFAISKENEIKYIDNKIKRLKEELKIKRHFAFSARYYLSKIASELEAIKKQTTSS